MIIEQIEYFFIQGANFVWGLPLLILLLGGGFFFMMYSRLLPFKYLRHALEVLTGKYDQAHDVGEISHFQALASHLAATIGMGNISGVAVAIATGGPGAIFWMWISAIFGMSTKFFTCTLAVMYRGKDSNGDLQGGPMYVISEGMGEKWRPLAIFFCVAGFFGATPIFQANQIIAAANEIVFQPAGIEASLSGDLVMGLVLTLLTGIVIFGGIQRIGSLGSTFGASDGHTLFNQCRLHPFFKCIKYYSLLIVNHRGCLFSKCCIGGCGWGYYFGWGTPSGIF